MNDRTRYLALGFVLGVLFCVIPFMVGAYLAMTS
jgi:heme/copper-type cytochrome/quinol oxidase subunit 4